jgi:hypothetical protein
MSMAKDGRICKPGVKDWPTLLRRLCPPEFWQNWLSTVERRGDARTHWRPKHVVLAWILIGWAAPNGLQQRFDLARRTLAALFPRRRRPGRSVQGLTKRTDRLGGDTLHGFWLSLRGRLATRLGRSWLCNGWRVFAVDGSRVEAPRTKANQRILGCAGREKSGPQWWITTLVHMPSRLLWDWRYGPGGDDERRHLREMLDSLPRDALLLADAAYVGYELLLRLLAAEVHFVIRCGGNACLRVDGAEPIERLGCDAPVFLWPAARALEWPLALRLITLKRGGRRMYLLTSVRDSTVLPRRTAGKLYEMRWGTELNFRALKQTLERRKLLARTPRVGEMELVGNLLALALLQAHAALLLGARAARMSIADWLHILRRATEAVRAGRSMPWFRRAARAAVRDNYVRKRPKKSRDYPRKKRNSPPGPPKILNLTTAQKTQINRLESSGVPIYG